MDQKAKNIFTTIYLPLINFAFVHGMLDFAQRQELAANFFGVVGVLFLNVFVMDTPAEYPEVGVVLLDLLPSGGLLSGKLGRASCGILSRRWLLF